MLERLNRDYGAPRFGEALLRGVWRGGEAHTVSANLLYVNDNVALDAGRGETAGADDESTYGWLRWQYAPSPSLSVDSVLSLTDVGRRRDARSASGR